MSFTDSYRRTKFASVSGTLPSAYRLNLRAIAFTAREEAARIEYGALDGMAFATLRAAQDLANGINTYAGRK